MHESYLDGDMTENLLSLWLIPEPSALWPLKSTIEALSRTFGGPIFSPHITLLSRIATSECSACERAAQLAERISPIQINAARIAWTREYFQVVVLKIPRSSRLTETRAEAERLFSEYHPTPWRPHLSLAYGHIDATRFQEAIAKLTENIPKSFIVGALEVVSASSDLEVRSWRSIRTFPLGISAAGGLSR